MQRTQAHDVFCRALDRPWRHDEADVLGTLGLGFGGSGKLAVLGFGNRVVELRRKERKYAISSFTQCDAGVSREQITISDRD